MVPIKQPVFHGKYPRVFFVAQLVTGSKDVRFSLSDSWLPKFHQEHRYRKDPSDLSLTHAGFKT